MTRPARSRRTTLAVPSSNPRMIEKARGLDVDALFLDLEDACAPDAKPEGRRNIVEALEQAAFEDKTVSVRVNDWTSPWTYQDVVEVVSAVGGRIDCVLLPKVNDPAHITALDLLLGQVERSSGLEFGRIGIEAQIEDARGLLAIERIAGSSPRLESLIFGPADFMASIQMKSLAVGEQPPGYELADAYHHVLMSILVAARANDLQAIDGPHLGIHDIDGLRQVAGRSAALGFDGKWVLHPSQVDAVNQIYSPRQSDYDHAENILDAYAWSQSAAGGARGAAMLGDEMIDEASRKMALVISAKGRAAGLPRTQAWTAPTDS